MPGHSGYTLHHPMPKFIAQNRRILIVVFIAAIIVALRYAVPAVILARGVAALPAPVAQPIDFTADILPILEEHCDRCHANKKRRGGFSMNTRESFLEGGNTGLTVVSGRSRKSPLIYRVGQLNGFDEMPPQKNGRPLDNDEIAFLRAWIDQGLMWTDRPPRKGQAH